MAITRMRQRRDTGTAWSTVDPILAAGEFGVDTDTSQFKIGDGSTPWSMLPFFASGGGDGNTITVYYDDDNGWPARPTDDVTVTVQWIGGTVDDPPTQRVVDVDLWGRPGA